MMMMGIEQSEEWLAKEAELLGKNCRFIHHKSHAT
jgi:hypothetical protein